MCSAGSLVRMDLLNAEQLDHKITSHYVLEPDPLNLNIPLNSNLCGKMWTPQFLRYNLFCRQHIRNIFLKRMLRTRPHNLKTRKITFFRHCINEQWQKSAKLDEHEPEMKLAIHALMNKLVVLYSIDM